MFKLVEICLIKLFGDHEEDSKRYAGYSRSELRKGMAKKDNPYVDTEGVPSWERKTLHFNAQGERISNWKPLGRLPMWARQSDTINYYASRKVNRYLMIQENRILKAVVERKFDKAVKIGLLLLKNSYGYQICLLNSTVKDGHYKYSEIQAKELLRKIVNKCRLMDIKMVLRRYYILKADGIRGRPIGAPDLPSKIISKSLTDLIYIIGDDGFLPNQHGFRRNRGAATAIYKIVEKIRGNPNKKIFIFEFDLKSFFNTVKPLWVMSKLMVRSDILAQLIYDLILQVDYRLPSERHVKDFIQFKDEYVGLILIQPIIAIMLTTGMGIIGIMIGMVVLCMVLENGFVLANTFDDGKRTSEFRLRASKYLKSYSVGGNKTKSNILKDERELKYKKSYKVDKNLNIVEKVEQKKMGLKLKDGGKNLGVPIIIREGLPQGLPLSPVLATLAMEMFGDRDEVVMYADDGVFIGDNYEECKEGQLEIKNVGASIAEEKSKFVENEFKFLGCIIDVKKEEIRYKGNIISGGDPELIIKLRLIYQEEPYKKYEKGGVGKVNPLSITAKNYKDFIDFGNNPIGEGCCIGFKSVFRGLPHRGYRMFGKLEIIDILAASSVACNKLVESKGELNLVATKPLRPLNEDPYNFNGTVKQSGLEKKSSYYEALHENSTHKEVGYENGEIRGKVVNQGIESGGGH